MALVEWSITMSLAPGSGPMIGVNEDSDGATGLLFLERSAVQILGEGLLFC